jgi:hypothetical protein
LTTRSGRTTFVVHRRLRSRRGILGQEAQQEAAGAGLDGAITDVTDADESVLAYHKAKGARIEERDSVKLCRYLITAADVLEKREDWPGRFIPIVPVVGEEIRIGRKLIRNGIVRNAKDPQRMSNYFHSAHTETVALQPKAPFMVTETNVAKYQELGTGQHQELPVSAL